MKVWRSLFSVTPPLKSKQSGPGSGSLKGKEGTRTVNNLGAWFKEKFSGLSERSKKSEKSYSYVWVTTRSGERKLKKVSPKEAERLAILTSKAARKKRKPGES